MSEPDALLDLLPPLIPPAHLLLGQSAGAQSEAAAVVAALQPADSQLRSLRARYAEVPLAARQQAEFPFAVVEGRTVTALPIDLYIPPEALEVFLEAFEGPLDLLLYLIRRQNLDILDIKVAEITEQYMRYVALMKALHLELAAEYLVMAAMLAEIKSRMLLPRPRAQEDGESEDPRADLIRRLMEYERFKQAAEQIDQLPRMDRDTYAVAVEPPVIERVRVPPEVDLREMLLALAEVIRRAELFQHHSVAFEPLSVRERMTRVLQRVTGSKRAYVTFASLFGEEEGRRGVVVTFLAIMELARELLLEIFQNGAFAPIHVRAAAGSEVTAPDIGDVEASGLDEVDIHVDDENLDGAESETGVDDV